MIPIKGYTTFQPLKHCIVGRGHNPNAVSDSLKETMYNTEEDLNKLIRILESMGVVCYRPNVEHKNKRPPISPRDYFIALDKTLFVGKLISGYADILKQIDKKQIKWFLDTDISSANIVRCGSHIHWDVSQYVSKDKFTSIMEWFKQNKYKVSLTRYGWHMDGVYSILKPGVIVASRDFPELQTIYPNWDICYLEIQENKKPIKHKWGGNFEESLYDVNILSVNEENCIVVSKNKVLLKFLEKHKINPVISEFRNKEFWDNGLHCVTQDLYREGDKENYF